MVVGASYSGNNTNALIATKTTINTHPSNQTYTIGSNVTFTIGATAINTSTFNSGTPNYTMPPATNGSATITYQWQVSADNGTNWANIANATPYSGATSSALTVTNVTTSLATNIYRVLIKNGANVCTLLTSNSAKMTLATDSCTEGATAGTVTANDPDADGINNVCDLDDDNDGIIDDIECGVNIIEGEFGGTFGQILNTNRDLQVPVTGYLYGGTGNNSLNLASRYVVTSQSNSANVHSSSNIWNNLAGHTSGSATDAYLAVNGSTLVGVFYKQIVTLEENSNYEISFWAINAVADLTYEGNPANLGYRLIRQSDQAIVASGNTGNLYPTVAEGGTAIGPSSWKKSSGTFNSGTETSFKLEIYNITVTAAGNDFAIDDIKFTNLDFTCLDTDNDGIPNNLDLDSDSDGCPDSKEAGILNSFLQNATLPDGNPPVATTFVNGQTKPPYGTNGLSNALENNDTNLATTNYLSSYGSFALDATENKCICYKAGAAGPADLTKVGISTLNRNVNQANSHWPEDEKGAILALDSQDKGMVITRMTTTEITAIPAAKRVEGMLVYDTVAKCLKLYNGTEWFCLKQNCVDNY